MGLLAMDTVVKLNGPAEPLPFDPFCRFGLDGDLVGLRWFESAGPRGFRGEGNVSTNGDRESR